MSTISAGQRVIYDGELFGQVDSYFPGDDFAVVRFDLPFPGSVTRSRYAAVDIEDLEPEQ
jgi:hypothetical protein